MVIFMMDNLSMAFDQDMVNIVLSKITQYKTDNSIILKSMDKV